MIRVTDCVTKASRSVYGVANAIEKNASSHKPPSGVFHLIFGFKVDFHCVHTYITPAPNEIGSCWGRTLKSTFIGGFKVSKEWLWFTFFAHTSSVKTIVFLYRCAVYRGLLCVTSQYVPL